MLNAGGNLQLAAGSVQGAQGASLLAGGNIELGTVRTETHTQTLTDRNGTQTQELAPSQAAPSVLVGQKVHREHNVNHQGVESEAGAGPLRMQAEGDITAPGAELKTEGMALLSWHNVTIVAKTVSIEEARERETS